ELGFRAVEETPGVDDRAFVGTFSDLLASVEGFHVEDQLAAIDLDKLGASADLGGGWRGGEVSDVDAGSDGGLIVYQEAFDGFSGGVFHERDQRWGGKDVQAAGADRARQERA